MNNMGDDKMETFIYQLMKQPHLIEEIKAGTFDYPESFTEEDKCAVLNAIKRGEQSRLSFMGLI